MDMKKKATSYMEEVSPIELMIDIESPYQRIEEVAFEDFGMQRRQTL